MPKVLWVALPLLAALALLAARAALGRVPSRRAVNVWSSLLLLVYVLATAGLGIFWVANQQLPVFDWHYLFGYGTVLLVALHLAFNFPLAWRHVVRPRGAAAATPGRRGVLALLGTAAAAGVAFVLGMRHGRSDLRIDFGVAASHDSGGGGAAAGGGSAPTIGSDAAGLAFVERFHAFSSHSRAGVLLRAPGTDWRDAPAAFKHHPGAARVALPPPGTAGGAAFDLAALGAVLWHTTGVTQVRGPLALRASPSSGALFSTELYVVARAVHGLAPGLWHHDAETHALALVATELPGDADLGAPVEPALPGAAAVVVATAVFGRTGHKYRDRTYRYVLADLGHALENLRLAAAAVGARAHLLAAFDESVVAATLGVDEAAEGVLAVVALHAGGPVAAAGVGIPAADSAAIAATTAAAAAATAAAATSDPAASATATAADRLAPMRAPLVRPPDASGALVKGRWRTAPVPREASGSVGITAAVHASTSLRLATAAAAPPPAVPAMPDAALRAGAVALPRSAAVAPAATGGTSAAGSGTASAPAVNDAAATVAVPPARSALGLIAARRSVRRYAGTPLAQADLAGVLAAMTTDRGGTVLSDAVRVNVVVHAVAGVEPGAYRHDAAAGTLLARRVPARLRDAARAAALDQDVIGDAAAVFVLSIDRIAFAADPLGPARGYRHAFIEAGLVGERVYLEAVARGLGACAVGAFYDDEAAALAGIDPSREWVVHFAALGVPAG